ncbi:glycosyltransferase family 4 protein, partial [Candidatus Pacearchaeota archaeon]|nr:glycosyltransferase family 4 protein [Candidatus Pacearchaeota archaeon]
MNQLINGKSVKIAVLGTRGIPDVQGGVETHCEHIYPEFVKLGNKVTVYRRLPYVKDDGITEFKGISLIDLPCPRKKSLEAIIHTFRGVMHAWHMKPDVLHIHAVGPALLTPLARLLGIRVVITHHGPDYQRAKWGKFAKLILRIGEWFGCRFANEVITISKSIAEHIFKTTGRRNITVIPNGVEIPELVETFGVGTQYGLEKGKYIFALGRFVPEKGFVDLIKAFGWLQGVGCGVKGEEDVEGDMSYNPEPIAKNLEPKTLNYKLVIAGDADHENETSRQIKALALTTDNVVLTGFIRGQSLCELFSHAGLFVIPS